MSRNGPSGNGQTPPRQRPRSNGHPTPPPPEKPHGHGRGHGHSHSQGHGHSHGAGASAADRTRLAVTLGLVVLYAGAEVVGGLLTNSLALLADAGHMVSDAAALALALFAVWISSRPGGAQQTYGYRRVEVLAALANGAALVGVSLYIVLEAVGRLSDPPEVAAPGMLAVAAGGLVVNGISLAVLHGGREASLNLRGAWLHVLTDALGSLQALAAGGLVWAYGWDLADPVASLLIAVLVVWSAWSLIRETVRVLLEQAPGHIDVERVRGHLHAVEGIRQVHDLHVWTITSGMEALSCHVIAADRPQAELLHEIRVSLHQEFGIDHVTVQVEPEDYGDCPSC